MKCPTCGKELTPSPPVQLSPATPLVTEPPMPARQVPPGPSVPVGLKQIVATFGQPGSVTFTRVTVYGAFGSSAFWCHKKIAPRLQWVFDQLKVEDLHEKAIRTFDGCYNNRNMRGGDRKSTHAWAIAVDLNCEGNFNAPGNQHPRLVELMKLAGFVQLKHDPMHFQYCTGY